MAFPGIKKINQSTDFNYFQKVDVNWSQFGAPDGYTITDGYGPDLVIKFVTQSIMFLNEGTGVVEYSFNGVTVHGELDSANSSKFLTFDSRVVSTIWFRVKSGSTGPIKIRVDAWGLR